MKEFLLAIILLLISSAAFSQTVADTVLQEKNAYAVYESYMQKAEKKKKIARTLVYTGGGLTATGLFFVVVGNAGGFNPDDWFSGVGEIAAGILIGGVGIITMGVSIPFFISSKSWEQRVLKIKPSLGFQKINIPTQNIAQPVVGVVIYL